MNTNRLKLIVSDLDDTLIHKDSHLKPEIIEMVKKLDKQGVLFTFATGRMPYRAFEFAKDIDLSIPFVANNGSILYANHTMVYCKKLAAVKLQNILQKYMNENPEFTVVFSYEDRERPLLSTHWIADRLHKYAGYDEPLGNTQEVWQQDVHKIYVVDENKTGSVGRLALELSTHTDIVSCYQYGEFSMEMVAAGCSKATGVAKLMEHLKLDANEIMAIGDHTNDIAVLQMAGIGVAVANAVPQLKQVAQYITASERAEGVLEAINKFVF